MSTGQFDVTILDWGKARQTIAGARLGTSFVFWEAPAQGGSAVGRFVLPILDAGVELPGLRLTRKDRGVQPPTRDQLQVELTGHPAQHLGQCGQAGALEDPRPRSRHRHPCS